jgi:hypothetical protein
MIIIPEIFLLAGKFNSDTGIDAKVKRSVPVIFNVELTAGIKPKFRLKSG